MNTDNRTHENYTCQPPELALRTPPTFQHWMKARWALNLLSRHFEEPRGVQGRRELPDHEEAAHALEVCAVYMAAHGRAKEGFAALASAQALRGRFLVKSTPRTALMALNGLRFFRTGPTCPAREVAA